MNVDELPPFPREHAGRADWLRQLADIAKMQYRLSSSRSALWAWARLFTFLAIFVGGYFYLDRSEAWWLALSAGGLLLFLLSIRRHRGWRRAARRHGLLRDIIEESLVRTNGDLGIVRTGIEPHDEATWASLMERLDDGKPCQALSRQELDDLDVFGEPLSLFGLLNRTSTPAGADRLRHLLTHPLSNCEDIEPRQDAVDWLTEQGFSRLQLMAAAGGMRALDPACAKFYVVVRDATPLPNPRAATMYRIWGAAGPLALIWGIAASLGMLGAAGEAVAWLPLIVVVLLNAIMMQTFRRAARERLRPWLELDDIVERLRFFTEVAADVLPNEGLLGLQRRRCIDALRRSCLPSLESYIPLTYLGLSGLMHTFIDVLVFWDLQVLGLLERSYLRHRQELIDVVGALAECEVFASLASFAAEEPDATRPQWIQDGCHLNIEHGRHPLIPSSYAVANSLQLDEQVNTWVVTGSNMSGKSTFLRMAGVGVLMARIGSRVTAKRMRLSPLELLSDLRIRDDLSRQESYFLAEVRQVRRIVDAACQKRRVFTLIDEPFRGTNSAERVASASAVIRELVEGGGVHLVATHDAALTALGRHTRACNRHFQESLAGGKMVFDYTLRDGPAESRNALKVLESEGYPPSLLANAYAVLAELGDAPPSNP